MDALGQNMALAQRARDRRAKALAEGSLDPFQAAQANYAGPGWDAFFEGLKENEESAQSEGKNFRVGWGGFGNAAAEGGSAMPRRSAQGYDGSLNLLDLNPLEQQAAKEAAISRAASDESDRQKAIALAQDEANKRAQQGDINDLYSSYQRQVLDSTLSPPVEQTPRGQLPAGTQASTEVSHAALPSAFVPQPSAPSSDAITTLALRGKVPDNVIDRLARLPGSMQVGSILPVAEQQLRERAQTELERHNKAVEAQTASGMVNDSGIDIAAKQYLTTGQMPPLGMGDKTTRQRIINRAGELQTSGMGSGSIAANKADYEADSKSLQGLQKQRDAIGAFENTAGKNLDIFLETAGKIVDTGSPLGNLVARTVTGKVLGSPNQSEYDAARQVAINEIAKVTTNPNLSGTLSDSARHEVEAYNPNNATLAQSVAVARILKRDMANRTQSLDDQISLIRGRLGSRTGAASGESDTGGLIYARDPQGKLHAAKAGTPLKPGWTAASAPGGK